MAEWLPLEIECRSIRHGVDFCTENLVSTDADDLDCRAKMQLPPQG
jgi:hypothetical protein